MEQREPDWSAIQGKARNRALRIVRDHSVAEDIASDVFLECYEKWLQSEIRNPEAWALHAAQSRSMDFFRRNKARRKNEAGAADRTEALEADESEVIRELDERAALDVLAQAEAPSLSFKLDVPGGIAEFSVRRFDLASDVIRGDSRLSQHVEGHTARFVAPALNALSAAQFARARRKKRGDLSAAACWIARDYLVDGPEPFRNSLQAFARLASFFSASRQHVRHMVDRPGRVLVFVPADLDELLSPRKGRPRRRGTARLIAEDVALASPKGRRGMSLIDQANRLEFAWQWDPGIEEGPSPGQVRRARGLRARGLLLVREAQGLR